MSYIKVADYYALGNYFDQLLNLIQMVGRDVYSVTNEFYDTAMAEAGKFTSDDNIKIHMSDFASDDLRKQYTSMDTKTGECSFDMQGYRSELKRLSRNWLIEKRNRFTTLYNEIGTKPTLDVVERVKNVALAFINARAAVKMLDNLQLSLIKEIENIVGKENMEGYHFDYVTTIGANEDFYGNALFILGWVTKDGEVHSAKELVNAAADNFYKSDAAVVLASTMVNATVSNGLNIAGAGTVAALNLLASGLFNQVAADTASNLSNRYYNMTDQEVYQTVHPGEVMDPEKTKERQGQYMQAVYGYNPYDEDNENNPVAAPYIGAVASVFLTAMTMDSTDNPQLEAAQDRLLESLGSEKTMEQARADREAIIQEIREERAKEEQKVLDASELEEPQTPVQVATHTNNNVGTNLSNNVSEANNTTIDTISSSISDGPTGSYSSQPIVDVGGKLNQSVSDSVGSLTKPNTNFDSQALNEYYSKDMNTIETDRAGLLNQFEDAYNGINVDSFKDTLAKGGYSAEDISYIMDHKEVGFTALVMATQTSTLTDISATLATQQGITNFTSAYSEGLRLEDLLNGKAQASLGVEMDPDVTSARTAMSTMRSNYNDSVNKANDSIKQADDDKAALEKIKEKIIKKSGNDASKWSDDDIQEYNDAVNKYNESNAKANEDVAEANRLKKDLDKFENDFEELKSKKYDELLKDFEDNVGTLEGHDADSVQPEAIHEEKTIPKSPAETFDGSNDAILDSLKLTDEGIKTGPGGEVGGVTQSKPTVSSSPIPEPPESFDGSAMAQPQSFDGSDQAILNGLNLGDSGIAFGNPDAGMSINQPATNIEVPPVSGYSGTNNIRVNSTAFMNGDDDILSALNMGSHGINASDRVLPNLGLDVDMSVIKGENVRGITTPSTSQIGSDQAIMNSLNMNDNSINVGSTSNSSIDTPSVGTMVSPEFDSAMSGGSTVSSSSTDDRDDTARKSDNTSRFVEAPTSGTEKVEPTGNKTKIENGITIEITEDGSLKL